MLYSERLEARRDVFDKALDAARDITEDSLYTVLQLLAKVRAPTGSVARALGPTIRDHLQAQPGFTSPILIDFERTRNIAIPVRHDKAANPVVVTAHGDEISYWAYPTNETLYWSSPAPGAAATKTIYAVPLHTERLLPASLPEDPSLLIERLLRSLLPVDPSDETQLPAATVVTMPAALIKCSEVDGDIPYEASRGHIRKVHAARPRDLPPSQSPLPRFAIFDPESGSSSVDARVGDRIVFDPHPPTRLEKKQDDILKSVIAGIIDNRAGVAMMLSALLAFSKLAEEDDSLSGIFVVTDGEEGISEPPVFSTGAQLLIEALAREDPKYRHSKVFNIDGHEYENDQDAFQENPLLGGIISGGKGHALPLESVAQLRTFSDFVAQVGGPQARFTDELTDAHGREIKVGTSRSDEEGLRRAGKPYYDIYTIGYGIKRSHHFGGAPSEASLPNLVATTRWLVLALVAACHDLL